MNLASPLSADNTIAAIVAADVAAHPDIALARAAADNPNQYAEHGQFNALLGRALNDPVRLRAAADEGLTKFARSTVSPSSDTIRERAMFWAIQGELCRPVLTASERAEWVNRLNHWGDCALGRINPKVGTLASDSDRITTYALFIDFLDSMDDNPRAGEFGTLPAMNGKASYAQMKAQWPKLFALAQGGEWMESSEYNTGTLQHLFIGALAVDKERYPEIVALAADVIEQLRWTLLPDGSGQVEWGDVQAVGSKWVEKRVACLALAAALTGDPDGKARAQIAELTPKLGLNWHLYCYRVLWVYGAIAEPVAPQPAPVGFRSTAGGLTIHRGPNHLLAVLTQTPTGSDHAVPYSSDVRLWLNGKWVLDHPIGYGLRQHSHNTALLAGLGRMRNYEWSAEPTPTGCIVRVRMSGQSVYAETWNPPPEFVEAYERIITFEAPARVNVEDFVKLVPPTRIDRYKQPAENDINSRSALLEVKYHTALGDLTGGPFLSDENYEVSKTQFEVPGAMPPPAPVWSEPEVFESETTRVSVQRRVA